MFVRGPTGGRESGGGGVGTEGVEFEVWGFLKATSLGEEGSSGGGGEVAREEGKARTIASWHAALSACCPSSRLGHTLSRRPHKRQAFGLGINSRRTASTQTS
eukprot:92012-Chlamydomonas_euryale.AAC.1